MCFVFVNNIFDEVDNSGLRSMFFEGPNTVDLLPVFYSFQDKNDRCSKDAAESCRRVNVATTERKV